MVLEQCIKRKRKCGIKVGATGVSFLTNLRFAGDIALIGRSLKGMHTMLKDLANEADTAYKDGKYDQSVNLYSNIISSGFSSGQLYYNLGNSYFKSGRLGPSILMYERAVQLMPHSDDVRHNLEFARSRTLDRIDQPPRLLIWT